MPMLIIVAHQADSKWHFLFQMRSKKLKGTDNPIVV